MSYSFFDLTEELQADFVKSAANADDGVVIERLEGMCAWVYVIDKGATVYPRRIAAKVPRKPIDNSIERARRFLREIEIEHSTYKHNFVGWAYDYDLIFDTPVAFYRLWDEDLSNWIPSVGYNAAERLATFAYICSGLQHCRLRGVKAHQDLKPQNILMRKMPGYDTMGAVLAWPMIADFGLANLYDEFSLADGAKPYMSPEQWLNKTASPASDVFSLGVILCELLSRGYHPNGEKIGDWWPNPIANSNGEKIGDWWQTPITNSKKWLRDDFWKRWADNGNPIERVDYLCPEVDPIIRSCLEVEPNMRPNLGRLQHEILQVLRTVDPAAFEQAEFQIAYADSSAGDDGWPYRDSRLERLKTLCADLT